MSVGFSPYFVPTCLLSPTWSLVTWPAPYGTALHCTATRCTALHSSSLPCAAAAGVEAASDASSVARALAGGATTVVAVPSSINGDLPSPYVEAAVGFDSATKVGAAHLPFVGHHRRWERPVLSSTLQTTKEADSTSK